MAKENYKPVKPADIKRPSLANIGTWQVSLADHAFRQAIDPRRRPEVADSRTIKEDHTKMSNLPSQAIHRQWNPGKFMPHYWMESEVTPFDVVRFNEAEDE
jgi:hypothetical protein